MQNPTTTRANVIARHRIPDDAGVTAAVVRQDEIVLNIAEFALHMSREQARAVQREIGIARIFHDLKHEGVVRVEPGELGA